MPLRSNLRDRVIIMGKMATKEWKKYRICDIFQVKNAHSILWKDIEPDSGPYPYVTASESNNSVVTRISYDMTQAEEANTIMIGGKTLVVTFQEQPYFSNDSHNLVLKLKCDEHRNKYVQLFLVTVLQADLGRIYTWGDSISSRSIQKDVILLPSTALNEPDYAYMESYMRSIEPTAQSTLMQLKAATDSRRETMDTSKWGKFSIGELFDVVKGSRLTKAEMREGTTRYIGASSFNNGITTYISNDEHIHPANTLTVCYNGSDIGRTFYQSEPYWATDDVNVLYPKFKMNEDIALFFAPIIKCVGGLHEYDDKWKLDDMKQDTIRLPVKADGSPDFEYMKAYIQEIRKSAEDRITVLCSL